jgi:hypothetical protein
LKRQPVRRGLRFLDRPLLVSTALVTYLDGADKLTGGIIDSGKSAEFGFCGGHEVPPERRLVKDLDAPRPLVCRH